ncbi:50S ribosomal protein L4 [bacterium BMS3Abin04]|nr:50S ribosomal protein L4 [bacterium BMS3Abin04]
MKADVYKIDGSKSGETVELSKEIFEIEPNDHVVYLAVKSYLANQRQGTHKAKERNEVRGGGRKPWRQKGRGGARAGTIRSPLWIGGGTIFGPKPHKYTQKLNKKVKRLARKSALSIKAKNNQIMIVEDFDFNSPKTKSMSDVLNSLNVSDKKTLILTNGTRSNVYKSSANIKNVNVLEAYKANAYELLNNQVLILQKGALENLTNTFH